jgi:hypothetical protein
MSAGEGATNARFDELKPGDRITIRQTVARDGRTETRTTTGTVIRTTHARPGSLRGGSMAGGPRRDRILLELPDGELMTITVNALTELNRA